MEFMETRRHGDREFKALLLLVLCWVPLVGWSQVGEYRRDLAIGVNGGYMMSQIHFMPEVPQNMLGGMTMGVTARYTCEKYFKSICAVEAEVNIAQTGWNENILDLKDQPLPLHTDPTQNLYYRRKLTYLQIPILARLGWGRERKGLQFFIHLGPQFGLMLSEKTESNFDVRDPAFNPVQVNGKYKPEYKYPTRASVVVAQDSMAVENKFDYGIALGGGLEFSHPKVGHFIIDGRYYYGLGNIFSNSKRDYFGRSNFGRSNFGQVVVKFTYLFDIIRTKNDKIK